MLYLGWKQTKFLEIVLFEKWSTTLFLALSCMTQLERLNVFCISLHAREDGMAWGVCLAKFLYFICMNSWNLFCTFFYAPALLSGGRRKAKILLKDVFIRRVLYYWCHGRRKARTPLKGVFIWGVLCYWCNNWITVREANITKELLNIVYSWLTSHIYIVM